MEDVVPSSVWRPIFGACHRIHNIMCVTAKLWRKTGFALDGLTEVGSNIGATSRVWDYRVAGMTSRSWNVLRCHELYQPWELNVGRGSVVLTIKPCKHLRVGDHKL